MPEKQSTNIYVQGQSSRFEKFIALKRLRLEIQNKQVSHVQTIWSFLQKLSGTKRKIAVIMISNSVKKKTLFWPSESMQLKLEGLIRKKKELKLFGQNGT